MYSQNEDSKKYIENQIYRRTNRGRKELISLPKNFLKCDICLKYIICSNKELFKCYICKCLFHKLCYDQYIAMPSDNGNLKYRYVRCEQALKNNKNIKDYYCFIYGHANKTLNYDQFNNIFYHQTCIFFLNEIKKSKYDKNIVSKIKKWRFKHSCKYCGLKLSKSIAVIKCNKSKCKNFYHVPCAIEKGLIFDINFIKEYYQTVQIPFYFSNHNKKIYDYYKKYVFKKLNCEDICDNSHEMNLNESDYKNDVFYLDFENIVKNIKLENEKNISEADSVKDFQMVDE